MSYVYLYTNKSSASRFIIDTLNGSIDELPEEGWNMLNEKLHLKAGGGRGKLRKRFWKGA